MKDTEPQENQVAKGCATAIIVIFFGALIAYSSYAIFSTY